MPAVAIALTGCPHSAGRQAQPRPASQSSIRFQDITQQAGIHFDRATGAFGKRWMPEIMGGGGGFIDYDNDGLPDIILVNGDWWDGHPLAGKRPTLALYHNDGGGRFTDTTAAMGLAVSIQGMGCAAGDFDGDGWDDLFVTAVGRSRLFRNDHGNRFVEVTNKSGIDDRGWPTSAAWVDYDGDGKLDLFVCHYLQWSPATDVYCGTDFKIYCRPQEYAGESCRLYHNEGGGKFRDTTRVAGIFNGRSKGLGISVCDFNNDNRPDFLVACDMQPNLLYRNDGSGKFTEIAQPAGIALDDAGVPRGGMGMDTAFYRNDSIQGLVIGNFYSQGLAFYDMGDKQPYVERAKPARVYEPTFRLVTFGLFFADFDNDGWEDLLVSNGHIYDNVDRMDPTQHFAQPTQLFHNKGDGTFDEVGHFAGDLQKPIVGRAAARGDIDNDGREDVLLVPNIGTPVLLRNTSNQTGHWLGLKLVGVKSNRDGYGALVQVQAGGKIHSRYCASGSSYLSASESRVHVGLGNATQAERVTIKWSSGRRESWIGIPIDRYTTLTEGTGVP